MVDPLLDAAAPISWNSLHLDNAVFTPNILVPSVGHLDKLAKFDIIIISVTTLQSFQDLCVLLAPHVNSDTLVVVESTGYVNLEPFVLLCFPKSPSMAVCSIMYESDVKRVPGSNTFLHKALGTDHRIYVGTCTAPGTTAMANARDSATFAKFYKMLQMVQEDLKGHVSLLKLTSAREFMTYQWKLALPRIVLNPISIIFEEPYPLKLEKQILAKPLMTGLVNEMFKVIKKMDCKLVKGFENEANLLKNWLAYFPETSEKSTPEFADSNSLFFRFYHQQEIDVDLLLLQPILLGDDHGVRTPYLENLYSILCQLNKMNTTDSSLFFTRKLLGYDGKMNELNLITEDLARLQLEKQKVDSSYQERLLLLKHLESTITEKRQARESALREFESVSNQHLGKMAEIQSIRDNQERMLAEVNQRLQQKQIELQELESRVEAQNASRVASRQVLSQDNPQIQQQQHLQTQPQRSQPEEQRPQPEVIDQLKGKSVQVQDTPDLSDFADVAVYGAALNGEHPPAQSAPAPPAPQDQPRHEIDQQNMTEQDLRELELQRRERALLERERGFDQSRANMPQDDYYNSSYNGSSNGAYNGYNNNYYNGNAMAGYNGPQQSANGGYNGGNRQQSNHSLTSGQRPPIAQHDSYYDQKPPHGLPPNGFPQNSLPSTLNNPQRYQQNGPQQMNPNAPRQRMSSIPNLGRTYPDQMSNQMSHQMPNQMYNQQHQFQSQPFALSQMSGNQQIPSQIQGNGPQQHMGNPQMSNRMVQNQGYQSKKQSRRSAFPDQALNIDYGGRGGMPMPVTSSSGAPNKAKHRSMMQGLMGAATSPPIQQRKSMGSIPVSQPNHLRIPAQTGSETSNSSNMDESPKTSTPDSNKNITIEVPVPAEVAPKPLGGVAPVKAEKKKKGFLRKG